MKQAVQHAFLVVHTWLRMDFFGRSGDGAARAPVEPGAGATTGEGLEASPQQAGRSQASHPQAGGGDAGGALTWTIFTQSFFAFVLAALLFDGDRAIVPYAAANLSLSTLFVGIGALADPQRAMRRRRADAALLHTAPVGRAVIPLARGFHGAFYIVLIATGMAIPPAIFAAHLEGQTFWTVPAYIGLAALLASLCAATISLLLRFAETRAGVGPALLLAGTLRAVLFGGGFIAFALCLRLLGQTADDLPLGRIGAWSWPPYHAALLLAYPAAWIPAACLAGLAAVLALGHVSVGDVSRPRSRKRAAARSPGPLARIEHRLAHGGALFGATRFVATMLFRSPSFRARVLPLLGMPVAMSILTFLGDEPSGRRLLLGMTMQFPAVYLPFLIAFLPNAERIGSGQVFRASPDATVLVAREASLIALTTRILTPLILLGGIGGLAFGGEDALTMVALTTFSWGAAVLLAASQLSGLNVMPFTLDSEEQSDPAPMALMGVGVVVAGLGGLYALGAGDLMFAWIGPAIAVAALARLRAAPRHARA